MYFINYFFFRQSTLASQRHNSDDKRNDVNSRLIMMDNEDEKLLDVVGSPDSPMHHSLPSASTLPGHHPSKFINVFALLLLLLKINCVIILEKKN